MPPTIRAGTAADIPAITRIYDHAVRQGTASIELHRAAGFRYVGNIENVGFKSGRWLDSVILQRALGAGATTAL